MTDYSTQRLDTLRDTARLVRELVAVIEELTYSGSDLPGAGYFAAVQGDTDVSELVEPAMNRAKAFLIEAELGAEG